MSISQRMDGDGRSRRSVGPGIRHSAIPMTEIADGLVVFHANWQGTPNTCVTGVAALADAGPHDLSLLVDPRFLKLASTSNAGAIVVSSAYADTVSQRALVTDDPRAAFREIVIRYFMPTNQPAQHHATASIHPTATVGESTDIGAQTTIDADAVIAPGARIGTGARIGRAVHVGSDSVIGPNAVLHDDVFVGDRVTIGAGSVIGGIGFGFVSTPGGLRRAPHVGTVTIEDDVEIGSNCNIDRAQLGVTRIGCRTRIDSLVHVGHGVDIGADVVIVAQCGISGSVVIGDGVTIGGQAGISDHVTIAPGVNIGSRAAVMKSITTPGVTVAGTPARPLVEVRRNQVALRRLADFGNLSRLAERVRTLERERPTSETRDSST
jgi:UDP-3-O-[3-hydroxymyristoyl] glucosamine N-acyltransferase